ncbi:IS3 family transposase [Corallococcus sp. BB11-1]|uniref:IS3 family transposase n=1 Tax=Corallococcus sp. BB11-1 TaxID=2996783 RepID=UPI003B636E77
MPYTDGFKSQMVKRMVGPGAVSAAALARQVGVSQPTLSQWLREANKLAAMTPPPEEKKPAVPAAPKKWTPEEKLRVLVAVQGLTGEALGALLRGEGLHEEQLQEWQQATAGALSGASTQALPAKERRRLAAAEKRVKELERELRRKEKALAETAALLVLEKKSGDGLGRAGAGRRGRRSGREAREMTLAHVEEALQQGVRLEAVCERLGVAPRTIQRWRKPATAQDGRCGPRTRPANRLSEIEKRRMLAVANSEEFRDVSPKQLVPRLADRGEYVASEASFYRVLREAGQLVHRGRAKPPTPRPRAEHTARAPCQVWSWDITYLKGPVKGCFLYLYLVVDVFSRRIMGWRVHEEESSAHAAALIRQSWHEAGCPEDLVLHSDNGGPMKGATMLATLQWLGVAPSFSRPRVSDDNAFSEALFRTLKYRPSFPQRAFASTRDAQAWVVRFVTWYNTEHRHSAIRFVTPEARHFGLDVALLAQRHQVYQRARARHPERWSRDTRDWTPAGPVRLNPSPEGQELKRIG